MDRLTNQGGKDTYILGGLVDLRGQYFPNNRDTSKIYSKLGQLEDIEEELGIDLITLLKAFKDGYWYRDKNNNYMHCDGYIPLYNNMGEYYIGTCLLSNYGKTWALTREELEK